MLKSVLSFFGIVGKATPEQTEKSLLKMKSALKRRLDNSQDYSVVFGCGMKAGVTSTKISCYAVGFSKHDSSLAVVPIYYDSDEIEDLIFFPAGTIKSIRISLQGEKIIESDYMKGDLRFSVPYFTNENADELLQLPIVQMEAAAEFDRWIKNNF